ncbi:unnamed protein product [Rotaria sp. Silwood1]|nr:unnamed protein product [Rotaria sp. Silwood1]CAF3545221.1 unnamed protein product [Rotaria sp. Silwood1]CAF3560236.1 unnamed protein product [Rotaria sp. Silwood1]CAF4742968.1 unnamed protein product [Rotaria sp. Silwood1]
MSPNQIHIGLIDFDYAWMEQENIDSSNSNQVKDTIVNDFYRVPQFDVQSSNTNGYDENIEEIEFDRRSRTIDTSCISAILYWMTTGREPKCSIDLNGKAPHQRNGVQEIIHKKLLLEAGKKITLLLSA